MKQGKDQVLVQAFWNEGKTMFYPALEVRKISLYSIFSPLRYQPFFVSFFVASLCLIADLSDHVPPPPQTRMISRGLLMLTIKGDSCWIKLLIDNYLSKLEYMSKNGRVTIYINNIRKKDGKSLIKENTRRRSSHSAMNYRARTWARRWANLM